MPLAEKELVRCEQCGTTLQNGASSLGCVNCLLLAGLGEPGVEGRRFQHYEVCLREDGTLDELGRGAMGITYHALDVNLGSAVALKVISARYSNQAEARERFRLEARAAAQLRHPNVASVFHYGETAAGQCFYAMELVEGETLETRVRRDGPLPAVPALEIVTQVARALMAAESHKLVHRDLKPSNLMALANDPGGADSVVVKVIDFGLAKAIAARQGASDLNTGFSGTPDFASPEQFNPARVVLDARSDIYSLGATLWYLLCGRAPFPGRSPAEPHGEQLHDPLPLEQLVAAKVPAPVVALLRLMLEVNPADRPQSARDLLAALRRCRESVAAPRRRRMLGLTALAVGLLIVSAVGLTYYFSHRQPTTTAIVAAPEKSIAVLPFENLSSDKESAFFADGIQDEILTKLAKISALKVISRTSTQQYGTRPGNLSEIARQLNVANILEGSVQKAGDQVHINAQLIRATTGEHLWAESYDRKLEKIFSVEADVATAVAEALKTKLSGAEQQALAHKPTNNPEAYSAYLHGLAYSLRLGYSEADNLNAIKHLGEAVKLDPKFAIAWAWLARESALGYFNQIGNDFAALRETARRAVAKVVELQPDLGDVYLAEGFVHYYCDRDYDSAIASFEKAAQLSPNNSEVFRALGLVWRRKGQWQRSLEYFRQATELDPRDISLLSLQGDVLWVTRQYSAGLKTFDQMLEISPDNGEALAGKVGLYQQQGNLSAAATLLSRLRPEPGNAAFYSQIIQWTYERRYDDAIAALKDVIGRNDRPLSDGEKAHWASSLALFQQFSGDTAAAHITWQQVQTKYEQLRGGKTQFFGTEELALAYIGLGDKTKAFAFVKEDYAMVLAAKDEFAAASFTITMGKIAAQAGEKELALDQLAISAQGFWGLHYGDLKLNPIWDSLRGDPRFEEIVASLAPKDK